MQGVQTKGRLQFLDTLRGLAAAYVVLYHMVLLPNPGLATPEWATKFAHTGGTGVTLFFIVSAFSLFYTMPFRLAKPRPIFSFYLHRFFRIAPLFYVLIAATLLRDHYLFGASHSVKEILKSVLFVFNFDSLGQQGFVWAGWTIGVEMIFYAIFPLIYFRVKNIYSAVALAVGFLMLWQVFQLSLSYFHVSDIKRESILHWSVVKHLPIFACGAIAFFLMRGHLHDEEARDRHDFGVMLLVLGAFAYMALLNGWLPNLWGDSYYWQGVAYLLLIIGLCFSPLKWVVNSVTAHLGKISYSVYLIHPTVVYLLIPVYRKIYDIVPTTSLAMMACFAVTFSIVILIAELTYRFVEEPGIKLGKKVYEAYIARRKAQLEPTME
jgi:peptidoglycan/LPS O-acetylase OafA/YrhL